MTMAGLEKEQMFIVEGMGDYKYKYNINQYMKTYICVSQSSEGHGKIPRTRQRIYPASLSGFGGPSYHLDTFLSHPLSSSQTPFLCYYMGFPTEWMTLV